MRILKENKNGQIGEIISSAGHTYIPPQLKEFEAPRSAKIIDDNISRMKSKDLNSLAMQFDIVFEGGMKIEERREIIRSLVKEEEYDAV